MKNRFRRGHKKHYESDDEFLHRLIYANKKADRLRSGHTSRMYGRKK